MHRTKDADDLEVMLPDATVRVDGRDITVREFRFAEGLRATPLARPIVEGLRCLVKAHGENLPSDAILGLLGEHHEAWVALVAISTGESEEWVRELDDDAGLALALTFWRVNRGFFSRRLVLAMSADRAAQGSPQLMSSASSSAPATEPTPPSSPSASPGDKSSATTPPRAEPETSDGPIS